MNRLTTKVSMDDVSMIASKAQELDAENDLLANYTEQRDTYQTCVDETQARVDQLTAELKAACTEFAKGSG